MHPTSDQNTGLLDHDFLIVGLARNCESTVRADILTILHALDQSHTLSWLIVESDSTDDTGVALQALANEIPNFRVISLGSLSDALPLRTQRIAYCRNAYLAELDTNPLYTNVAYVVVADLDGANELLTSSGLASCWDQKGWDVCTANQRGPYYDIWALRHKRWCPNDCWQQYAFLIAHGVRRETARHAAVYSKMITIAEDGDWIEVDSAFGGLAVYRRAALTGVEYSGLTDTGDEICEHVALHTQILDRGGRIFINPRLINACENWHARERQLIPSLKRYFRDFLRDMPLGA
jgi:hypothetical protein